MVIPEPMATLVASKLKSVDFEDLWKSECDKGSWEIFADGQNAPSRTGDAPEPVGGARSRG